MADIYQTDPNSYYAIDAGESKAVPKFTGDRAIDQQLAGMTDDERQQYIKEANAPLTGEDVAELLIKHQKGEIDYEPTNEEYLAYKEYMKAQNHDILSGIAQGFEHIAHTFINAGSEFIDHPTDATIKLPTSVAEGFFQGGRNLYGMLAQAQDPNSPFFRFKNVLTGDGSDVESERRQFIDAMNFNRRSYELEEGKSTLVVDKDLVNHNVMIASSFIADPTLLIPVVGEVTGLSKLAGSGMRAIGIGERMAKLTARAGEIQNKVLGGTLKWGVGTPIEFMGGAVRNTIDYGTAQSGRLMEAATGLPMSDWRATMRMGGLGTMAAEAVGIETGIPYVSSLGKAQLAGTFGQGLGQAITAVGDQMIKQSKFGRGMLSYAGQALKDTERAGIALSPHAKNLLTVIDAVDPLFSYSNSIIKGSAHGAGVGAFLGWGSGDIGSGIGAGLGLGAVGGGMGRVMAGVSGHTFSSRLDIQSKMVMEGWKSMDANKPKAEAFGALKEFAKTKGQEAVDAVNGYIAGIDVVAPDAVFHNMSGSEFKSWAESQGYDANTKHFQELTQQFKDYGLTREEAGKVNSILRDNGNKFAGDSDAFREHMAGEGKNLKYSKTYQSLSENAKKAVDAAIDRHDTLIKDLADKGQTLKDFYGNMSAAEKFVDDINAIHKSDPNRATIKAKEILDAHRDADGKLNERGKIINDKLRAEGYTDKDGNVAPRRNMHRLDLTNTEFNSAHGFTTRRESDGKVHIYLNLDNLPKTTFPHELFHAIMRESPMKDEWMKRLKGELLGSYDANGNLIRKGTINLEEARQFMKRYAGIDPSRIGGEGKAIDDAIKDYQQNGTSKKLAESTIPTLEKYIEEFGAYYFSHWLGSKPADYLFHGGELTGMRGLLERVKDGWLDYWENKMSNTNPEFNFKTGNLDKAFSPDGKRIRVGALDAFSRDFLRATANSNRGAFDPRAMAPDALRDFTEGNGIYTASERNKSGRTVAINEAQYDRNRIAAGKEIFKVLDGLDPAKRGTKTIEMDGKKFITGRFSEAELDAIVKSGHRNRAWADKHQQLYSVLDGKGSNVIEFGYLGRTAQIGDFSWPRLTGKQVPFKNRSAILFGMESHIGQDGNFYTVFHTLDKAVIDARGNDVWKNPEARKLWADDRGAMEQDFFAYLANASKADNEGRVPSAVLLDKGDRLGAKRRDWLHQMLGIHKDAGDSYFNKPIAEIPEGIRHSVTSFNMDGATNFRVADGGRFDVNNTAIKDLSRNFQPKDMDIEETPNGKILTHASGWKIVPDSKGNATAYNKAGKKIGTYDSVQKASEAVKQNFQKLYSEVPQAIERARAEQDKTVGNFQPALTPEERQQAIESGDLFSLPRVRAFTEGIDNVLRQTRQEFILQKATEAVKDENSLFERFKQVAQNYDQLFAEQQRLESQVDIAHEENERLNKRVHEIDTYLSNLRDKKYQFPSSYANFLNEIIEKEQLIPPEQRLVKFTAGGGVIGNKEIFAKYEEQRNSALSKLSQDTEYIKLQEERKKIRKFQDESFISAKTQLEKFNKQNRLLLSDASEIKKLLDNLRDAQGFGMGENPARYIAEVVKGNIYMKDWSGLLEQLFADGYDSRIETGKPFVAVSTHGTGSVDLMQGRLFLSDKLATNFDIPSSRMGSFSAGSQDTSKSYARFPATYDIRFDYVAKRVLAHNEQGKALVGDFYGKVKDFFAKEYDVKSERLKEVNEEIKARKDLLEPIPSKLITEWGELSSLPIYLGRDVYANSRKNSLLSGAIKNESLSLPEWFNEYYNKIKDFAKANDIYEGKFPDKQMQLRTLIKMENPYVVVDPRSYEEHWISPHMKEALKLGHDGIVFKRFSDPADRDTIYVVFKDHMDKNIMTLETAWDENAMPRGNDESGAKVMNSVDLGLHETNGGFQPKEEGGIVYDQNSKKWKSGFLGLYAIDNPERVKGMNLQFFKKQDGSWRVRLTDNSRKGESADVGHITASISGNTATLSSHINKEYRGNKLSYVVYSEMAERLRAMGITKVEGTIVNPDGVPVKVRERIIGDTRDMYSGKPISQIEAAIRIKQKQELVGSMGGVDVENNLYPQGRYQPKELPPEQGKSEIKEGYSRMFHQTAISNAESIRKNGLLLSKSSPHSEAKGVFLSDSPYYGKGHNLATVELQIPSDEKSRMQGMGLQRDIKPEDILAVHEPWHDNARYIEKNKQTLQEVVNGEHDSEHNSDDLNKAIAYIKDKYGKTKGSFAPKDESQHPSEGLDAKISYLKGLMERYDKFKDAKGRHNSDNKRRYWDASREYYSLVENRKYKGSFQPTDEQSGIEYGGGHKAPSGENGEGSLDAMDRTYPEDLYSTQGVRYYGSGFNTDKKMHELIMKFRGKPDAIVTVYRAVPKGVSASINKGDWVTPLKEYAVLHGNRWEQGMTILEKKVKASELFTEGNSIYEFGWSPKKDKTNGSFAPKDYEGGDSYWKPKKNIFESRDEQGLLVRKANVWNSEITGDPEAKGGQRNPDYVGWEDIGHYPQQGTNAENIWEAKNSGLWFWKDDKGVKIKNPMEMDRPDFTHAEWFDKVFQYEEDKPTIYGRYEKPKYDKKGNLIERGRLSMSSNYRGEIKDMADANFYKEAVAKSLGVSEDHIDAYLFSANDKIKAQRGYGVKDQLAIKFQPKENIVDWKSERTNLGNIIKNSAGYVISEMNGKFRVYNPYKVVVGIYDNLDKAKQTVIKDSMKGQKQ